MEKAQPKKQADSRPIHIRYSGDPIQALEAAAQRRGPNVALILIPAALWNRLVGKDERRLCHAA